MDFDDRYGNDVLATDWRSRGVVKPKPVAAEADLVVEVAESGFCGAVVRIENKLVHLEDRHGKVRAFPLGGGFLLDGAPVILTRPVAAAAPGGRTRTASGSFGVADAPARVARASRIFVEGRHDAELVEKVWGDDLRVEGVVVEYLEGVDDLDTIVRDFAPTAGRRIGVLVDHLVPHSKESRIADTVARGPFGAHVLVVGHPYIDIWQAVKPQRVGLKAWPNIPRSIEWKEGHLRCTRPAARESGGHRPGLEEHPRPGEHLRRPRAGTARPRRAADRLRHGRLTVRAEPGRG